MLVKTFSALNRRAIFMGNLPMRTFASMKEYDVAVIGGGPGGK